MEAKTNGHMRDFAVYTVCTGHYKYGLFALIKSLRKNYSGPIIIGTDKIMDEIANLDQVEQVILQSDYVFGNLKSKLVIEQPAKSFVFLDADIIVINPIFISFLRETLQKHNRLIVSAEATIPQNDIRRLNWNVQNGIETKPVTNVVYNGGFFAGTYENHLPFLKQWQELIHKHLKPGEYLFANPDFPMADQDIMNSILQNYPEDGLVAISLPDWESTAVSVNPFYAVGRFKEQLFVHCTGKLKPWLIQKLPLRYPNLYDRLFFKYSTNAELGIKSDLKFNKLQQLWFTESRLIPFYNKIRVLLNL